jgi:hypothetical protein
MCTNADVELSFQNNINGQTLKKEREKMKQTNEIKEFSENKNVLDFLGRHN